MRGKATDRFSIELEQAKAELERRQKILDGFSAFSLSQAKSDAQKELKQAKEAVEVAQKKYNERWGRVRNEGGFTPAKRAEVHAQRHTKEEAARKEDYEKIKNLAGAATVTPDFFKKLDEKRAAKKAAAGKEAAKVEITPKGRNPFFAKLHNQAVAAKSKPNAKLPEMQRSQNRDVKNDEFQFENVLLRTPTM